MRRNAFIEKLEKRANLIGVRMDRLDHVVIYDSKDSCYEQTMNEQIEKIRKRDRELGLSPDVMGIICRPKKLSIEELYA